MKKSFSQVLQENLTKDSFKDQCIPKSKLNTLNLHGAKVNGVIEKLNQLKKLYNFTEQEVLNKCFDPYQLYKQFSNYEKCIFVYKLKVDQNPFEPMRFIKLEFGHGTCEVCDEYTSIKHNLFDEKTCKLTKNAVILEKVHRQLLEFYTRLLTKAEWFQNLNDLKSKRCKYWVDDEENKFLNSL